MRSWQYRVWFINDSTSYYSVSAPNVRKAARQAMAVRRRYPFAVLHGDRQIAKIERYIPGAYRPGVATWPWKRLKATG